MGMIYIDSCILIYAVEETGSRGEATLEALYKSNHQMAASPLVLNECLVGPLKNNNFELRDRYLNLYSQFFNIDLSIDVMIQAANLRALTGIKTPDSIHLAAAQQSGCSELWTNDRRLQKVSHGMAVNIFETA